MGRSQGPPRNKSEEGVQPVLRWPGGKRWLASSYAHLLPTTFKRYVEPFLGSAAVYFHLRPERAVLGDTNGDLIGVYKAIKTRWREVLRHLQKHERDHSKRHYYRVRASTPSDLAQRAAKLIYLNRTCFNGIYRVNRDGQFNVPKGSKQSVILPTDDFEAVSRLLATAKIKTADFATLIAGSQSGDLVFADPPYTVRHNSNAFVKYNETLFSWEDQKRLASELHRACRRGVKIVAMNANHQSILDLYRGKGFSFVTVSRFSSISASAESRQRYEELAILGNVEASPE